MLFSYTLVLFTFQTRKDVYVFLITWTPWKTLFRMFYHTYIHCKLLAKLYICCTFWKDKTHATEQHTEDPCQDFHNPYQGFKLYLKIPARTSTGNHIIPSSTFNGIYLNNVRTSMLPAESKVPWNNTSVGSPLTKLFRIHLFAWLLLTRIELNTLMIAVCFWTLPGPDYSFGSHLQRPLPDPGYFLACHLLRPILLPAI